MNVNVTEIDGKDIIQLTCPLIIQVFYSEIFNTALKNCLAGCESGWHLKMLISWSIIEVLPGSDHERELA